ncbi:MAG: tyrosine-type recombinase/integrase [Terriglobia bacterium]|nr:tyrosine-type recombinase/integrase [Terriglobia bacterium]
MPAIQCGQAYRLGPNRWGLRYYDATGNRRRKSPFASKSAALAHYREIIEPQLRGEPAAKLDLTFSQFVRLYLERHAASVRSRTIATLRERLRHAEAQFGDITLRDLERMADEIAGWQAKQPDGIRYGRTGALRQTLEAAVRWGYLSSNPAKLAGRNRQPAARTVRAFTRAEIDAVSLELSPSRASLPAFVAATGLRPEEWQALERRDVDRTGGVLSVRRSVSDGQVVELGKTSRSRRQVPLSPRALAALDALPARLDSPLIFPAVGGGILNVNNFRNREWRPAIEAAGVRTPARLYDLRSTFASNALAAGVSVFELARIMGTSVEMIERHYGTLLDGSGAGIASRLAVFEAEQERLGHDRATAETPKP